MPRYYEVPRTFKEWRQYAFYSIDDCTRIFKVHRTTVLNWESGRIKAPQAVLICLQLFNGRLDFLGKEWRGFRILPDCIESPGGDYVRAWEISALRYAMDAIDMRREVRLNANTIPENVTYLYKEAEKKKSKENHFKNNSQAIDNKEFA